MHGNVVRAALALALVSLPLCCAAPPQNMRQGGSVPPDTLVGRVVTAKIDLPLRYGMVVYGNGEVDLGVYRLRMESLGASIRRYERARITRVQKKGNRLQVRLNSGGRSEGLAGKNALRWVRPEEYNGMGTEIFVEYGRRPTADDVRPESVAHVLRDVLEIDGVAAPAAAAGTPSAPAGVAPAGAAATPGAKILSVEVQPSRVARGRELDLAVHFEVEGASSARPLGLIISRQVYRGEERLFATPRTQQGHWAAGVHSAHFSLKVPSASKTGVYRFRAWITQGGKEEAREALFEVLE